jgi:hypothetical protein
LRLSELALWNIAKEFGVMSCTGINNLEYAASSLGTIKRIQPVAAASVRMPSTECIAELFAEHSRRVLRATYRITGNMADAEEVAQGVFLRLASSERPMDNVGSYVYIGVRWPEATSRRSRRLLRPADWRICAT